MSSSVTSQAVAIARRDLGRERRTGEVLWVTVPFGAIAMIVVPLAVGAATTTLERIGPGLFWAVVMLFGVLIAVRRSAAETGPQRDLLALLGVDPVAVFAGKAAATTVMLLAFEVIVGLVTVVFYNVDVGNWGWLVVLLPLASLGLGMLGTLAGSIAASTAAGPALIPLIVAPLAVPLLLAASETVEALRRGTGILPWLLLMLAVDVVLSIAGVLTARPLQETP